MWSRGSPAPATGPAALDEGCGEGHTGGGARGWTGKVASRPPPPSKHPRPPQSRHQTKLPRLKPPLSLPQIDLRQKKSSLEPR